MVYVPGSSLEAPGFHSRKGLFFACQFLSIVAQIFAFLVYWEGIGDHISVSALFVCSCSVCTGDILPTPCLPSLFCLVMNQSSAPTTCSQESTPSTPLSQSDGNGTLRHLAMMYVNKPTTDDPDDESD